MGGVLVAMGCATALVGSWLTTTGVIAAGCEGKPCRRCAIFAIFMAQSFFQ